MKEAKYYIQLEEKKLQCKLCPHNCIIKEEQVGKCKVRKNIQGKLYSLTYNVISSLALDPIEKKPLYHFYPGKKILSIGSFGCNFKCGFCQNWEISQISNIKCQNNINSKEILFLIEKYNHQNIGIAFTYNEPLINFEFILETSQIVNFKGYKNVLVTNGFINKQPFLEILPFVDALNIDLKSFNKEFYKKICDGNLNFVLQTIELSLKENKHIELTVLVIPNYNDSEEEIKNIINYVSSLSNDIPIHFSKYYPMYKFDQPSTPIETLIKIYKIAKEKLNYVYLGNIQDEKYNSTFCPKCKSLLISRINYEIKIVNLKNNKCSNCNQEIKIIT